MSHQLSSKNYLVSLQHSYHKKCLRCDKVLGKRNHSYFCYNCYNTIRGRKNGRELLKKLKSLNKY